MHFARDYVRTRHPGLADRIDIRHGFVHELDEDDFDLIISKDVLEHVMDPGEALAELGRRLRAGGRMLLGWGPLWFSPFGDHRLSKELLPFGDFAIPWAHLMVPERFLLSRVNGRRGSDYRSIEDYGLNKLPYREYERILTACGLRILSLRTNVTNSLLGRAAGLLSAFPPLRKYVTSTVYCSLERVD